MKKERVCKICKKSTFMKVLIDKEFQIYDERHFFCFKCKKYLKQEEPYYGNSVGLGTHNKTKDSTRSFYKGFKI